MITPWCHCSDKKDAPLRPQYGAMQTSHHVKDNTVWPNMIVIKVRAWEIFGPRMPISKAYTLDQCKCNCTAWTWPQCQSSSWELLYDKSQIRTQNAVKDKNGNSLKTIGQTISSTNKHEDLNLMFANHAKRMEYIVLLQ